MPLQKIVLKPGVNRENTRYTNEGGYYESNLVRFRQGTPEKIGGWTRISANTFTDICRSLWNWVTLTGANLIGVGTESKFFISQLVLPYSPNAADTYYDITPIVSSHILSSPPIATVSGSYTVTVTDTSYHPYIGDYVIFTGMATVNGVTLNGQYKVIGLPSSTTYTVTALQQANATGTGGGAVAYAAYLLNVGNVTTNTTTAWGSSTWGSGTWGGLNSTISNTGTKLWAQYNFGENLLFGPKLGAMYYWNANVTPNLSSPSTASITIATPAVVTLANGVAGTLQALPDGTVIMFETTGALPTGLTPYTTYYTTSTGTNTYKLSSSYANYLAGTYIATSGTQSGTHTISSRAVPVSSLAGASDVPLTQNTLIVSDASRFTIVFGTNDYGSTIYDPMIVRWSDQESVINWTPAITNQSGSLRLSHGSSIQAVLQARQEILVFTDAAMYSLQYLGPPYVWGSQILSDNISIVSINAAAYTSGMAFWMGQDKFYKYDGRVQTLRCDLRQFIYDDINRDQFGQIFASTNEGFNEVWWFYCTENSTTINRYVVYNYVEDAWYYGSMARTAWLDSSLRNYPIAATYSNNLVYHEDGVDDNTSGTPVAMSSSITTSQFDIGDGHNFAFVWRMLPDLTFRGSTDATTPSLTIQLQPLQNSGSGYNDPISIGGTSTTGTQTVAATYVYPQDPDLFTGQLNIRVRGRQMSMRIACNTLGTQWQLGAPRIDIRPDGRRGG